MKVSAIMLLLSVFCGAYGSISHELALPRRFLPAEHALEGLLRGNRDQRPEPVAVEQQRQYSPYLYRFCTDRLTLEAHFCFSSYYRNSSPSVHLYNPAFPPGEHRSYRRWLFHIHLQTIPVWPLLTLSGLMALFFFN